MTPHALAVPSTRVEPVTETLHGVEIVDPYRWLEDGSSAEVETWVAAQNAYTAQTLSAAQGRERLRAAQEAAQAIGLIAAPQLRGGRVFYQQRSGSENQPLLYVRETIDAEPRALLDPNTLREDGSAALDWWYPSHDGALLAYGVSEAGDEKSTLRVLDVATGAHLPDEIPHTRYCSIAWLADRSGFYYTRYPAPGAVEEGDENYNQHAFLHQLGRDWTDDPRIFGEGRDPREMLGLSTSRDGRWLLIHASFGWNKTELYLLDSARPDAIRPIVEGVEASFSAEIVGDELYILTDQDAPSYQLFKTALAQPERAHWRLIVAQSADVLQAFQPAGEKLLLIYLRNAASHLVVASREGVVERTIELPTLGSIEGVAGEPGDDTALLTFASFFTPQTLYRYSVEQGRLTALAQIESPIDTSPYEVRQVWYPSRDGTRISMFLMHRRGLALTGDHPTVLTGYGGFNVSMTPYLWRSLPVWLQAGGVAAIPNLRGGGEYGESWHQAGMLGNKQNVFDDFIGAAEWLIAEGYTTSQRLAIVGGSNGGLLVGAALTQRPDLFRAVVCRVPLLDMLRYQQFLIARLWIPEYGSADDPEQFAWLHAYSPYHHVTPGTAYPAVLFTAAESDSRVDPLHARKMAALLQARNGGDGPILLRIETRAGHGVGKPLHKVIDEEVDIWSFIGAQLDVTW
jgi:prolyl oligopeptidase